MSKLTDAVLALAGPVAAQQGCEIWDVEYVKEAGSRYLRVYIDKPDGVSIQDCEDFSRALDPILDEADPIPDSYIFEVSSAGAERQLKRPSDFAQFMGASVTVRLYSAKNGSKEHTGTLRGYEDGAVSIETPAGMQRFEKNEVAMVRLHVDF